MASPRRTDRTRRAKPRKKTGRGSLAPWVDPRDVPIAKKIGARIEQAGKIVILGHERPDGDCLGSTIALGSILREQGHDATVLLSRDYPKRFKFLNSQPWVSSAKAPGKRKLEADLAIVLDTAERSRVGGVDPAQLERVPSINIDHHFSNSGFGQLNWVDAEASAAGELVWRLAACRGWPLSRLALQGLYAALVTDTGQFAYSNTTPRVLRMAAELVEAGVDPEAMWRRLYLDKSRAELDLEARARSSMEVWAKGQICAITITQRDFEATHTGPEFTQEFPGIPRGLAGAKLALFFYAVNGGEVTKVSIRSVKEVDACALAQRFGGGGHRQAAGCAIARPMKEAKRLFRPAAEAAVKKR